ncbi:hypothetical protein [Pantoea sp. A4]|uniref:hypothetical protein n=1 Tax=Pantoea sp. A4 TaxID=1225184 RepID=UPI000364D877|nr:hypothetical protein [Pantoea sp. A4]
MLIKAKLQRLNLLEQWRRDSYRIYFSLAVLVIYSCIIRWVLPLWVHGNIHDGIVGCICGLAATFWLTCIARLTLPGDVTPDQLTAILTKAKYHATSAGYYDVPLHKRMKFKSQRIYIESLSGQIILTGPYNILKRIRNKLEEG